MKRQNNLIKAKEAIKKVSGNYRTEKYNDKLKKQKVSNSLDELNKGVEVTENELEDR